jgi:hypothetical protein
MVVVYCLLTIGYWLCTAVLALVLVAPGPVVARTAVLALVRLAPVLSAARTAVLALVLVAPVLAVARTAVFAKEYFFTGRCTAPPNNVSHALFLVCQLTPYAENPGGSKLCSIPSPRRSDHGALGRNPLQ